jgi:hypothetical protein
LKNEALLSSVGGRQEYASPASVFFLVLARNSEGVREKIDEIEKLGVRYLIVCGEKMDHQNVVFREGHGKWDAINFGAKFVPKDASIVVMNDVDTSVHNFQYALSRFKDNTLGLVYCKVKVDSGPQKSFYEILNPIRARFHIAASGELMIVRKQIFESVLPIPPCLAEDSYIMFKALELGFKADFCSETFTITKRTASAEQEEMYKFRTTLGIYQALQYSRPPPVIRAFYAVLPFLAPLLSVYGENGRAWMRGIERADKARLQGSNLSKF